MTMRAHMYLRVCVCDLHCSVSQLGAMGPVAGFSFVSSWDRVFHLSAPVSTILLYCFITITIATPAADAEDVEYVQK